MLRGRLGLETARIPHADRHGLLWLSPRRADGAGRHASVRTPQRTDSRQPLRGGRVRHPLSNAVDDPARPWVDGQPRRPAPHGSPWHRPRCRG